MLICHNCGMVFDELDMQWQIEPHGERRGVCPNCHDDQIGEAEWCPRCGEHYPPSKMSGRRCDECKSDMLRLLREATVGVLDTEDLDYLEYELGLGGGTLGGHP